MITTLAKVHPVAPDRTLLQRLLPRSSGALIPAIALLGVFFALPVLALLLRSVMEPTFGIGNYVALFGSSTYVRIFFNTFVVAGLVTSASLLLGLPVAWFLAIAPERWSRLIFGIMILSMWTNLLARTYAWMVLLQDTGLINRTLMYFGVIHHPLPLINNLTGVTIGMTYIMLPFVVLPLHATIKTLDHTTFQAAALCGASLQQSFLHIFLPLTRSALATAGMMVFVMSLGYFVTPSLLGGTSHMVLAELIAQMVQSLLNWGLAGAAAFVLLVITLGLYAVQIRYLGFSRSIY